MIITSLLLLYKHMLNVKQTHNKYINFLYKRFTKHVAHDHSLYTNCCSKLQTVYDSFI